jgi:N-acetylglutamate synthase-like GNAT family acetyltransferase
MSVPAIIIRRAIELDQLEIRKLVHSERLNPNGLEWPNFIVAAEDNHIVGAVQMRKNADGSRELGSLVVRSEHRGRGIAGRMIDVLLAHHDGSIWMVTASAYAEAFARWGFRRIAPRAAPARIRLHYRLGSLAGVISLFKRRPLRRLVILQRDCQ